MSATPVSATPNTPNTPNVPDAGDCELCREAGGQLIVTTDLYRIVRVLDESFPAFYRVVWNAHRAEFTDLTGAERSECMHAVAKLEHVMRRALKPTKINLAALGNMVPHVHWHVIARFDWDSHFPQPIWGEAQRQVDPPAASRLECTLDELDAKIVDAFE